MYLFYFLPLYIYISYLIHCMYVCMFYFNFLILIFRSRAINPRLSWKYFVRNQQLKSTLICAQVRRSAFESYCSIKTAFYLSYRSLFNVFCSVDVDWFEITSLYDLELVGGGETFGQLDGDIPSTRSQSGTRENACSLCLFMSGHSDIYMGK